MSIKYFKRRMIESMEMKKAHKFLAIALAFLLLITGCSNIGNKEEIDNGLTDLETETQVDNKFISALDIVQDMGTGWNLGNTLDSCDFKRNTPEISNYQIMAVYDTTPWSGWDASPVVYFNQEGNADLKWEIQKVNSLLEGTCGKFSLQIINNVVQDSETLPLIVEITSAQFTKIDGSVIELVDMIGRYELPIAEKVSEYIKFDLSAIDALGKTSDVVGGTLSIKASIIEYPQISQERIEALKTIYYETLWGNPVTTKAMIDMVADAGFKSVRIPVTYYDHLNSEGVIDEAWLEREKEIVDYVLDNNLICIINIHHDTGENSWIQADLEGIEGEKVNLANLWQQIGEYFIEYDERLVFEGFNEILNTDADWSYAGGDAYEAVNLLNQQFVDTVRGTGGNNAYRNLIVKTYAAAGKEDMISSFQIPEDSVDNHLIVGIHYYSQLEEEPAKMDTIFNRLNENFVDKGIPVIIGEFSSFNNWDEDESIAYVEKFMRKAQANECAVFWWDRGGPENTSSVKTEALLNRNELYWYSADLLNAVLLKED
jgi:aryl-phospho-beta-D-glucosidase BglC (GH1 family)